VLYSTPNTKDQRISHTYNETNVCLGVHQEKKWNNLEGKEFSIPVRVAPAQRDNNLPKRETVDYADLLHGSMYNDMFDSDSVFE
jgi:hypothetical protein